MSLKNRRIPGEEGPNGPVHLPGSRVQDAATLCGWSWPAGDIKHTDDVADCRMCLEMLEDVRAISRCRRLRAPRPKS